MGHMARNDKAKLQKRMVRLARYSKALSHPARLAILEELAEHSTCVCGEIVDVLPLAQSTVSQHLKELKESGLVRGSIDGLNSCYCLDPKGIKELQELSSALLSLLESGIVKRRACK